MLISLLYSFTRYEALPRNAFPDASSVMFYWRLEAERLLTHSQVELGNENQVRTRLPPSLFLPLNTRRTGTSGNPKSS
jgi:hypothetical protein